MTQYIDKSALVADIEKRIEAHKETLKNCDSSISEMVLKGSMSAYQSLLHFIGTLETKRDDTEFHLGAEWADENPNERMIAKYLYEKKGYPIDLNGNLPSFEETMKDVEKYNKYKEDAFIEKACNLLARMIWEVTYEDLEGDSTQHYDKMEFIEDFKNYMKGE